MGSVGNDPAGPNPLYVISGYWWSAQEMLRSRS